MRTDKEIEDMISLALEEEANPTLTGMGYGEGVRSALDWISNDDYEPPFEDE